jgi:hypothetical protein
MRAGRPFGSFIGQFRVWLRREDGASSVDWIVVAAGATAMGMLLLDTGKEELGDYTANVRDEIQSPYFVTEWTDHLPLYQD